MCRYQGISSPWQAKQLQAPPIDTSYLTPVNADEVVEAYLSDTPEDVEVIADQCTDAFNLQYTRVAAAAVTPARTLDANTREGSQGKAVYGGCSPSPSLYAARSAEPEICSRSSTIEEGEQELMLLESIIRSEADCF
ncbi:hypothetical protein H4R20_000824 [Coemansia guatemalensis]|uniref:Uncharacterized protein n=1 Tax=Coemansia guatemalensis TaxID=2761395 RepID=A0A9W8I5I5_9FUNG|nr:hypothetical protein H4R20_000824 [Coemansia guatemalensis]